MEPATAAEAVDLTQKGTLILSVTENGYGKRTPADEYRLTNRAGKGVINIKTTERVGKVVAIALVDENSQVMLISQYGKIIRMDSKTIRESGRNAQGVRLLHMEPGDRVAAAVVLAPEEEPNGNGGTLPDSMDICLCGRHTPARKTAHDDVRHSERSEESRVSLTLTVQCGPLHSWYQVLKLPTSLPASD